MTATSRPVPETAPAAPRPTAAAATTTRSTATGPAADAWYQGLRVVRLCSVFPPGVELPADVAARFDTVGGMQTHTDELTRALDEVGVLQTVVTTRPPGTASTARRGHQITVRRVGLPVAAFRQLYAAPASLVLHDAARGADLLHAHLGEDLAVVPLAVSAARRFDLPLVLTVHCSVGRTLAVTDLRSALMRHLGGRFEQWGERLADRVIVLTPRLAEELGTRGVPASRITVAPSGVRGALFDRPARPVLPSAWPRPRILFLGRLHGQKNVDLLLHAMAMLRHPTAHLVVAGDGPQREQLVELRNTLGLQDRVTFLGFVEHDRVPDLLHDADVLAMPSRYEELGTALVEAMAAGLPVVATRTGGIPQVIDHGVTGTLVEPGHPVALAAALDTLLADEDTRRRMSEAGRRTSREYRWDRLRDRVLDVYREALAEHAAR